MPAQEKILKNEVTRLIALCFARYYRVAMIKSLASRKNKAESASSGQVA